MYLQLQTRFNPFTYDEMVKPLADYGNAYRALESQYATLQQGAEQFRQAVESDSSQELKERYHGYTNALSSAINDFSQGMTVANRSAFIGLRGGFARDIQPIQVAFVKKAALADEQRKAAMANPSMIFEKNAADMSLEEFIKNPMADYGRSINGNMLTAEVIQKVKGLAQEARTPEGKAKLRRLFPFQYEMIQENGFSMESINEAIKRSSLGPKILMDAVDDTVKASGVLDWNNKAAVEKAYYYAGLGLYEAHGATQGTMIEDKYGMNSAMQAQAHAYKMKEMEKEYEYKTNLAGLKGGSGSGSKSSGAGQIPTARYSTQVVEVNTNYNKNMENALDALSTFNAETKILKNSKYFRVYGFNSKKLENAIKEARSLSLKPGGTAREYNELKSYESSLNKRNASIKNLETINKEYNVEKTYNFFDPRRYTKKNGTAEILTASLNVNDSNVIVENLLMNAVNMATEKRSELSTAKGSKTDEEIKNTKRGPYKEYIDASTTAIYLNDPGYTRSNREITETDVNNWGKISNAVINISNDFNVTASFKDHKGIIHHIDISKDALHNYGIQDIDKYKTDFTAANTAMMNLDKKNRANEYQAAKEDAINTVESFSADLLNTVRASYSGSKPEYPVMGYSLDQQIPQDNSEDEIQDSTIYEGQYLY